MKFSSRLILSLICFFCPFALFADSFNEGWTFWYDGHEKEVVDLPHDAMLGMPRSADVPGGGAVAYYTGGKFYYEKNFEVPKAWLSKQVSFEFGAIYMNSQIYINDTLAGGWHYGYTTITVNADGLLHEGTNTIRVETDNSKMLDSRWYSGAGIYRPVKIFVKNKENISSVKVKTLSYSPAQVEVATIHGKGKVKVQILDGNKVVAKGKGDDAIIDIKNAKLWNADHPDLYTVKVTLKKGFKKLDEFTDEFGVRLIEWSPAGLLVNGEQTLLKGACIHSDNGILGSKAYLDAELRRVSIFKQYGFNAIRSAHNPCSEELLKACDKLGMYVMDELWDMWYTGKNDNDHANWFYDEYEGDVESIVKKDYNHPSVLLYSIGNEVSEPSEEKGVEMGGKIVDLLHNLDGTRPVTAGINYIFVYKGGMQMLMETINSNGGFSPKAKEQPSDNTKTVNNSLLFNESTEVLGKTGSYLQSEIFDEAATPIFSKLDIAGYNYGTARYEMDGDLHPDRVIVGSETYPEDIYQNWQLVKSLPYVVGDFMWTGWDYMGEVGIGTWSYDSEDTGFTKPYPFKLGDTGALDILGNPTGEAFLAKVTWEDTPGKPYIGVRPIKEGTHGTSMWRGTDAIPSWSWAGCDGKDVIVEVFSSAEKIELYLNDKLLITEKPTDNILKVKFPYEAGTIKAKAYVGDSLVGEDELVSSTGKLSLNITPEVQDITTGHVIYIDINLVGENGQVESNADRKISVDVQGAKLLGFGSAKPKTEDRFQSGEYTSYYGKTVAAIWTESAGEIKISAKADGVDPSEMILICK